MSRQDDNSPRSAAGGNVKHSHQPKEEGLERSRGQTVRMWRVAAHCRDVRVERIRVAHAPTRVERVGHASGPPRFRQDQFGVKNIGHQCFLDRILLLEDVQVSWLLLVHCASQLHDASGGTWRNAGFQ